MKAFGPFCRACSWSLSNDTADNVSVTYKPPEAGRVLRLSIQEVRKSCGNQAGSSQPQPLSAVLRSARWHILPTAFSVADLHQIRRGSAVANAPHPLRLLGHEDKNRITHRSLGFVCWRQGAHLQQSKTYCCAARHLSPDAFPLGERWQNCTPQNQRPCRLVRRGGNCDVYRIDPGPSAQIVNTAVVTATTAVARVNDMIQSQNEPDRRFAFFLRFAYHATNALSAHETPINIEDSQRKP